MIRPMKRVYLLYTRESQDALVSRLQKLGLLHLEATRLDGASAPTAQADGDRAGDRKLVENLLIKARGVSDLLGEVHPELAPAGDVPRTTRLEDLHQQLKASLDPLEGRLKGLVAERRELRDRAAGGERIADVVRVSEALLRSLPTDGRTLVAVILASDRKAALPEIQDALERNLGPRFTAASQALSPDRTELIVSVEPDYAQAVGGYLEAKGARPVTLPPHVPQDLVEGIAQLKAEAVAIPKRLGEIDAELGTLAREQGGRSLLLSNALENRLAQLEAAGEFGYTDYTLLITGWIPAESFSQFEATLRAEFPGVVIREEKTSGHDRDMPISFHESRWAKPYQIFLQAFGTPTPGTVDPIPFISLFFPIFFGLIVGDVGYGLIIFAVAVWGLLGLPGVKSPGLKKMAVSEVGRSALTIMLQSSVFAILLGAVFGEFFGLGPEQLGLHRVGRWPFSRVDNTIQFLLITIVLGAIQVTLGFVFGMITALRHGDRRHFAAKVGLFLSLIAFTLILGRLMNILPSSALLPGIVILLAAIPLLIYGGGMMVILESLSPFVHVISYARIMGFGVASVILAELINSLAGGISTVGGRVVGLILGIIVVVAFQAFNLVLDVYEGTIQSLRLHWVEFFQKFVLENLGGKPYRPFKEKKIAASER